MLKSFGPVTTQSASATCRMVTALRPLLPSATSLLRRSLFLRPTRCQLPVRHKLNHGSSTHRIELHTAHAYAANCAGASNETAHVLGLARRALKQTIAPHSVVRRCTLSSCGSTQRRMISAADCSSSSYKLLRVGR